TAAIVSNLLGVATFAFGPSTTYRAINSVIVIAALVVLSSHLLRSRAGERSAAAQADLVVIRWGLLIFAAFAVWDNLSAILSLSSPMIEPFGFAAFLSTLGYVAARRTMQRDQQLNEIHKELEVARQMQLSILPPEFPAGGDFRVAARYIPMTSVAGDFY